MSEMTPAEFKMIRKGLNLSPPTLAPLAGVSERTVQNWDSGKFKVPDAVVELLHNIDAYIDEQATDFLTNLEPDGPEEITLTSYRDNEELWEAHPDFYPIPTVTHDQMLFRIYKTLKKGGIPCRVVYS